jgi:hypothetical protein
MEEWKRKEGAHVGPSNSKPSYLRVAVFPRKRKVEPSRPSMARLSEKLLIRGYTHRYYCEARFTGLGNIRGEIVVRSEMLEP